MFKAVLGQIKELASRTWVYRTKNGQNIAFENAVKKHYPCGIKRVIRGLGKHGCPYPAMISCENINFVILVSLGTRWTGTFNGMLKMISSVIGERLSTYYVAWRGNSASKNAHEIIDIVRGAT